MNIDKINEILKDCTNKSNKDLIECRDALADEFEKTKTIVIELTKHLDVVEENYNIINNEIGKRIK